jgi:arylsulfatase A-like enzyme
MIAAVLAGLLACGKPAPHPEGPPDLIVLLAPGLRADSAKGETGAETALLDALGEAPTHRFRAAYAQSPSPQVSMGSLLTGLTPSAIPLCGRYVPREYDLRDRGAKEAAWCARLPVKHPTWPAVLSLYDYRTALIRGSAFGTEHVDPAFDQVLHVEGEPPTWQTSWEVVVRKAGEFWAADDSRPRLLVVLASDLELPPLQRFFEEAGLQSDTPGDKGAIAHPETLRKRYAETAGEVGAGLKKVLAALPAGPRSRHVVLTSTHGVSLGERAAPAAQERSLAYDHLKMPTTQILLNRTIHVPLVWWGPALGNVDENAPVELLDLFPTLAALAGATPPVRVQGSDLFSKSTAEPTAYSEFGDMLAWRSGEHLLTFRCFLHNGTSLDPELTRRFEKAALGGEFFSLHRVTDDPLQQQNLQSKDMQRVRAMRDALLAHRKGPGAPPPDSLTPEALKALRLTPALGYW